MAGTLQTNIFFGVPPAQERNAIGDFLKHNKFKQIVIPCAGKFTIAEIMVEAGILPENIICADTSLVSSILGYYLSGQDLKELNIETDFDFIDPDGDTTRYLASIFYAMLLTKASETSYYNIEFKRALQINQDKHIKRFKENLEKIFEKLNGIKYQIADPRDIIDNYKDDPNTFIFMDPPAYVKNNKLFDYQDKIIWDEPTIGPYGTEEDIINLFIDLEESKATAMIMRLKSKLGVTDYWKIYHLSVDTKLGKKFLFLNRPVETPTISRPTITNPQSLNLPIIGTDHVITEDSIVTIKPVEREAAWYYRDLFTHRFGVDSADSHYLILIDGKIISVRGYSGYSPLAMSTDGMLKEIYGIVYNNTRYRYIGRLIMRLISSIEFANAVNRTIFPAIGITTTMYKNFTENREIKNIGYELYESTEIKEGIGKYKMKYRTPFNKKTFKDMIIEWLDEENKYGKPQKTKKRKPRPSNRPGPNTGPEGPGTNTGPDSTPGPECKT